jgi:predicted TIM-barrel fold metal-dependent hydrolase
MLKLRDLALKFPNITLVLDHCGFPLERTEEYFDNWRMAVSALAEAENVVCKLSGLGMCDWDWTVDSIRPWLRHCIDAFGPERCVLATNWPIDRLFSTYDVLIDAYAQVFAEFSRDERIAMYSGNAEALYGI